MVLTRGLIRVDTELRTTFIILPFFNAGSKTQIAPPARLPTFTFDADNVVDGDIVLWFEDVSAGTPGAEATQGAGAGQFSVDRAAKTCTLVTAAEVNDIITMNEVGNAINSIDEAVPAFFIVPIDRALRTRGIIMRAHAITNRAACFARSRVP